LPVNKVPKRHHLNAGLAQAESGLFRTGRAKQQMRIVTRIAKKRRKRVGVYEHVRGTRGEDLLGGAEQGKIARGRIGKQSVSCGRHRKGVGRTEVEKGGKMWVSWFGEDVRSEGVLGKGKAQVSGGGEGS